MLCRYNNSRKAMTVFSQRSNLHDCYFEIALEIELRVIRFAAKENNFSYFEILFSMNSHGSPSRNFRGRTCRV